MLNNGVAFPHCRVRGLAVRGTPSQRMPRVDLWAPVLWEALALCAGAGDGSGGPGRPAALALLDINFNVNFSDAYDDAKTPILKRLLSDDNDDAAIIRQLRVLRVAHNIHDEGADVLALSSFGFEQLQELALVHSGLTSARFLHQQCTLITKIDFGWSERLQTLSGLQGHLHLTHLNAAHTGIASLAPLDTCPALQAVDVSYCPLLTSLDGLQRHQCLQEVNVACTRITSVTELLHCPALTHVNLRHCACLKTLDGLEGHAQLQTVNADYSSIVSLEALAEGCPALTTLTLDECTMLTEVPPSIVSLLLK